MKRRHLTELPSYFIAKSRNTCFCRVLLPVKLSLLLAGALLVPLYFCRIIRLSIGKQLEKYEQLGIKLERYSDKAILGKECLG